MLNKLKLAAFGHHKDGTFMRIRAFKGILRHTFEAYFSGYGIIEKKYWKWSDVDEQFNDFLGDFDQDGLTINRF